jgi:hypothetical protein
MMLGDSYLGTRISLIMTVLWQRPLFIMWKKKEQPIFHHIAE